MILEILIFLVVAFFIAVLFYKQGNESFEILQMDASRLSELPTYYSEHSPIVIHGFVVPVLGTEEFLSKRPNITHMSVTPSLSLHQLIKSPQLQTHSWSKETASFLAKESGLTTWFEQHLFTQLLPNPYTTFLYSVQSSLWIHHRGLFKTTAFQTLIMPTQGTANVSIMLSSMTPYLPTKWQGKIFSHLTLQDTPLLNQIKFMDIKLRKGHILLLPPHLIADIHTDSSSPDQTAWVFVSEVHHPISKIAI
jgi:hypothetical protein